MSVILVDERQKYNGDERHADKLIQGQGLRDSLSAGHIGEQSAL